jgi:MFS transporter, DHA3 family, macrolide efflux protein
MSSSSDGPEAAAGSHGRPAGMAAFTVVWLGQMISVLATNMSAFAQSIWVFEQTGKATALALVQVFFIVPFLILSPVAGVMVDRYNRKLMMMVSDLVAILPTVGLLILSATGHLQVWHFYVAAMFQGIGNTFQWPAYSAAITTMVPKGQLGRANGMMSLLEAGPGVLAPILAGVLLPLIALPGILTIDVLTFLVAILALAVVFVPQPTKTAAGQEAQGSFWKEAVYGFKYIFARPSLLGLQLIFFAGNLFAGIANTLITPMILARTANSAIALGTVQSAGAIAAVAGGLVMSAWGGFRRRVHGVLAGWALSSLGLVIIGVGQMIPIWVAGMAYYSLWFALINGSNQAIWQSKVAPDVQGRVFSARRLIAWFSNPISPLIAGTMADFILEPAMQSGGPLAQTFGGLFGTGPGAGMGLLIAVCGILASLVGVSGYFISAIRNAETRLPDYGGGTQSVVAGEEASPA